MIAKSSFLFLSSFVLLLLVSCSDDPEVTESEASTEAKTVVEQSTWSSIVDDKWQTVHDLTELVYPQSRDPAIVWGEIISSEKHNLEKRLQQAVDTGKITQEKADETLRLFNDYQWVKEDMADGEADSSTPEWMNGYAYTFKVPTGYTENTRDYPVVIYLHGGQATYPGQSNVFMDQFYMPDENPYILVAPAKTEWDWDADKIVDVIEDFSANLRVNRNRIYLTGISMGGRGTYIVAAAMPDVFAGLMPLSSHHAPYSYVHLAPLVAHLPIWTSHGDQDSISSYDMAVEMVRELEKRQADVTFHTVVGGDHEGWDTIYGNPKVIDWLLLQQKDSSTAVTASTTAPNNGTCILAGGEIVQDGWSGKDTGSNSCNQCRCMNSGLACTKMACHQK